MTTIYLIRHAEAEGNLYRRIQGGWNGQITPRGRLQIEALAERFRDVPVDALYSSDLSRARDTAGAILKYHPELTLHTTPRLREVCFGCWEGVPRGVVETEMPEQLALFDHDPARWQVEGSERYGDAQERMRAVLSEIAERHAGKTVAVVSHGSAIRGLQALLLGVPSRETPSFPGGDNTSVTCLRYENGELSLALRSDASHLPDELRTFLHQTWRGYRGVRFEPLRFPGDSAFFDACYADAWASAHGSTAGYSAGPYLRSAKHHAKTPRAVVRLVCGDQPAGVIDMDPDHGRREGYGWISFFYLRPEFRGKGLGTVLLGHALWFCELHGLDSVRLHVAEDNVRARGFYERFGFTCVGSTPGIRGTLYQMEKKLPERKK